MDFCDVVLGLLRDLGCACGFKVSCDGYVGCDKIIVSNNDIVCTVVFHGRVVIVAKVYCGVRYVCDYVAEFDLCDPLSVGGVCSHVCLIMGVRDE